MHTTEITVQVFADLDVIFSKLTALGFTQIGQYTVNDWYFTHLTTDKRIPYAELVTNSFLVRQVIEDQPRVYLCYKDKEIDQNGNVISEEKFQVPVRDLTKTLKIFRKANLNCWCEMKQTLYTFRQDNIEFSVQAVAGLGNFIEYEESPIMQGLTTQQKIDLMTSQLKNLNLELGTDWSCKKIYMLYLKHRHQAQ